MRRYLMAGNWKMNKTLPEAVALSQQMCNYFDRKWHDIDIVLCPPAIDLKAVYTVLDFDNTDIDLGAQNVHWEPEGAFTGEISVPMIKEVGVTYCIVGHSERREIFGETDEWVNKKIKALVAAGIAPIVCVGESLNIREQGRYLEYVCAQVRAALAGIDVLEAGKVVIAYEPIWAIGTGRTATPEAAEEVCAAIRATVAEVLDANTADNMRILYGGSMNPGNVEALLAEPDIDGGLVGGASLKATEFKQLCNAAAQAAR